MEKRLRGKTVLITGAGSGIGKEISLLFAKEGADLCLVGRRATILAELTETCRAFGVNVIDCIADISDKSAVDRMAQRSFASFKRIDILVNNAGYGKYGPFMSTPIEEWDRMWMVNVRGLVLVTQAILPSMMAAKSGHIINLSSILGVRPRQGTSAYSATKFAVTALSEALANELCMEGIKVSTICLGGVQTAFLGIPKEQKNKDFLDPAEVAKVILDVVTAAGKVLVLSTVVTPRTIPFIG